MKLNLTGNFSIDGMPVKFTRREKLNTSSVINSVDDLNSVLKGATREFGSCIITGKEFSYMTDGFFLSIYDEFENVVAMFVEFKGKLVLFDPNGKAILRNQP